MFEAKTKLWKIIFLEALTARLNFKITRYKEELFKNLLATAYRRIARSSERCLF